MREAASLIDGLGIERGDMSLLSNLLDAYEDLGKGNNFKKVWLTSSLAAAGIIIDSTMFLTDENNWP